MDAGNFYMRLLHHSKEKEKKANSKRNYPLVVATHCEVKENKNIIEKKTLYTHIFLFTLC